MNKTSVEHQLSLLKKGDSLMLETIYKKNRLPFLNFAKKYELPKADVIDVYQDAIIALRDNVVLGKIETLNSSLRTYLFSIGKFMIFKKINEYKSTEALTKDVKVISKEIQFFDFNSKGIDPKQQRVNLCLGQLGEKCQQVLKLFYYDGLTLEEIQQHLGYDNYNVVKSQKSRCLKSLKDLINKQNPHE